MALEGLSAIQAAGQRPAAEMTRTPDVISQAGDQAAPRSEAADAFRDLLGSIHDNVSKFQAEQAPSTSRIDPVETAKSDILPSPFKSAPKSGGATGPAGALAESGSGSALDPAAANRAALAEGNTALKKSFDHAMFVTLVSQVISGVSQTTSTLIRQQ